MPKKSQAKSTKSRPAKSAARKNQFDPAKIEGGNDHSDIDAADDHDPEHEDFQKSLAELQKKCADLESKSKSAQRRLRAKRKIMQEAAQDYREADQHRKDCKSAFDKARTDYLREADAIADGQELLPFPEAKGESAAAPDDAGLTPLVNAKATVDGKARKLAAGFVEKCGGLDPAVTTVAQLEKLIGDGGLQKMSGVGPTMIDKVSDWVVAYRQEHPIAAPAEDAPKDEPSIPPVASNEVPAAKEPSATPAA